jgi:cell wall-associated NlpC family hydrolase
MSPTGYVDGAAAGALPTCPALPTPAEVVPAEPATPAGLGIGYDRAGAAQWAVDHAFDQPEIEGADCANFVSAALHLGGGIEVTDWWRPWSLSWVRADDLAFELSGHGYLSRTDIDPSDGTIPAAELGDVVLYDTGDGGGYHHVSIVVRIGPSGVVEVASHTNAYDYRVWNQSWLDRDDRTGFRAHLLHVLPT